MFVHFRTLSLALLAAFSLSACADLMYSLGLGSGEKKTTPKTTTQQQTVMPTLKTALPMRDEKPISTVRSQYDVYHAAQCLVERISIDFNLPEDFYAARGYDDGAATVALVNPATGKNGLYIDIIPENNGSLLLLYPNRKTVSTQWKKLPEKCR